MPWTTANQELRQLLRDGPTDRLRFRKRVFGEINGTNKLFKTFEFRRVTDLTTATLPLGVYINGVQGASVASDYPDVGAFELTTAPVDGDIVEASYYVQFFTDAEIDQFLNNGAKWLGFAQSSDVPPDLNPSCLDYAQGDAYSALALKFIERTSETYQLEDMPQADRISASDAYKKMASEYYASATKKRDEKYTRQGQSLQPLFGVVRGSAPKL